MKILLTILPLRSLHTPLNRRILNLIPLSLPPHTQTPTLYAHGISTFQPIYTAFETSLQNLLLSPTLPSSTASLLHKLHVPGLSRSDRLRQDSERLLPFSCPSSSERNSPKRDAFVAHIDTSLATKPHLHLAYTWIFYMALFSGGRYIRSRLLSASEDFWTPLTSSSPSVDTKTPPLTFWTFATPSDGEDLKTLYKSRVLALSPSLSETESAEIIAEAVEIMTRLIGVVEEAETLIGKAQEAQTSARDELRMGGLLLKHILPMGMVELIEGLGRGIAVGVGYGSAVIMKGRGE